MGRWAGCGIAYPALITGGDEMKINLKEFRKQHNLTQADMAREVGVSLETYRRWEMEVVNPNEENKKSLEKVIKKYE